MMQTSYPPSALHWSAPPSLKMIAFDFDDTLVESGAILREAYRRAGVEELPSDWKTRPGTEWAAPHQYAMKQHYYERAIRDAKPLPPAQVARFVSQTMALPRVVLLTAAKAEVIRERVESLNVKWYRVFTGVRDEQKSRVMKMLAPTGAYVDDLDRGEWIADVAHWSFIKYEGQTVSELLEQLGRIR